MLSARMLSARMLSARMLSARALPALALLALAACASTATGTAGKPGPADGDTFGMVPGAAVSLAGEGTLRYAGLVNDSRCQPDVQCIWAGDAEVAFEWQPPGAAVDAFSLHTTKGDKSHRIGRHVVSLVELARGDAPEARLKLEAAP
jgi:hypothetical protein